MKCFERIFDEILDKNATNPEKPPLTFKEADDLAVSVMDRMGIVSVVPITRQYYEEVLANEGNPREFMEDVAARQEFTAAGQQRARDPARRQKPQVGKVPDDWKLLRVGSEKFCSQYQRGKCTRSKDKDNKGCKDNKDNVYVHLCGVARSVSKDGVVRLCGNSHEPSKCSLRR